MYSKAFCAGVHEQISRNKSNCTRNWTDDMNNKHQWIDYTPTLSKTAESFCTDCAGYDPLFLMYNKYDIGPIEHLNLRINENISDIKSFTKKKHLESGNRHVVSYANINI